MRWIRCRWCALVACALMVAVAATAQDPQDGRHRGRPEREKAAKPEQPPQEQGERVRVEPAGRRRVNDPHIVVFSLKYADAEAVAKMVGLMQRVFEEHMVVYPDERTNAVVVAMENERPMEQIRTLVETLDVPAGGEADHEACHAVPLKHASADEVVEYLFRLAPRTPLLRFVADERANTVWLAGPEKLVQEAAELVERMEESTERAEREESANGREVRVYGLKHANPWELSNALKMANEWMDLNVGVAVAGGSDLIVFATPDQHTRVEAMIARMDVPTMRPAEDGSPADRPGRGGRPRGERQRDKEPAGE